MSSRFNSFRGLGVLLGAFLCVSTPALAQSGSSELAEIAKQLQAMQKQLSALQATVAKQQGTIATLQSENERLKSASQPASQPVATRSATVGQFNPDIGMAADFVGSSTQSSEDAEGNDRLSVREIELIVGHDIDPYARLDSVITFSDFESPHIEEAVVSYWGLPYDTKFKLGRFRPKIGIQSAVHRDQLETVDEPLVIQRYLGVEGLSRTGVELANFLPFSWDNPSHEVTVGMLEGGVGEGGELLGETRRVPTLYARLRNAFELSDFDHFSLGGTYLRGSSSEKFSDAVNLFVVDVSHLHQIDSIRRLKLQSELFFQRRSSGVEPHTEDDDGHDGHETHAAKLGGDEEHELEFRDSPFGMYALADYRLAQRFSVGTRFDYVQPVNIEESDMRSFENAFSGYLTFHQSEFARWRFQYQYVNQIDGDHDNRFFLQGTFSIGVHKHSLQ